MATPAGTEITVASDNPFYGDTDDPEAFLLTFDGGARDVEGAPNN